MTPRGDFGDEEVPRPEPGTDSTGEREEGKEEPGPSASFPEGPDTRIASERGKVKPFDEAKEEEEVAQEGLTQAESPAPVIPTLPLGVEPLREEEELPEEAPVQAEPPQVILPPAPEPVEPGPRSVEKPRRAPKRKRAKKKTKKARKGKKAK